MLKTYCICSSYTCLPWGTSHIVLYCANQSVTGHVQIAGHCEIGYRLLPVACCPCWPICLDCLVMAFLSELVIMDRHWFDL